MTSFPPPWDIEEHNQSCYIVRDDNGQALAYVYFESEPGRRTAAGLLTGTRPGGSRRTLRSCQDCCGRIRKPRSECLMFKISEGQYALGGLTVLAVWLFVVLPLLHYFGDGWVTITSTIVTAPEFSNEPI
jgi:hypothetical protein